MPGKPYIDDDLYGEPPGNQAEDIDTGPLTREQLQGLARDQIEALRHTMQELGQYQDSDCAKLLNWLEHWLCK